MSSPVVVMSLFLDGLHPNSIGSAMIADTVPLNLIKSYL